MSRKIEENLNVRVEVQEDSVLLLLPRRMDDFITPWQNAWKLGEVLEQAAEDIPNKDSIVNPLQIQAESEQIALNIYRDRYVVLLFRHTDRVKLSYEAARIVARAIRMKAQDLDFLNTKKVRIRPSKFFKLPKLPR